MKVQSGMTNGAQDMYNTRMGWREKCRQQWPLYLFLAPAIIVVFVFSYMPMYWIITAFQKYNVIRGIHGSEWVGLLNFQKLFASNEFLRVLGYTLYISALKIFIGFPSNIVLALLFNELRKQRFKRVVQTISYLPYFIGWVVVSGLVYDYLGSGGQLNNIIAALAGRDTLPILSDARYFPGLLLLTSMWKNNGYSAIVYIAALSGINTELYDAAMIDGCGRFKRAWHVTLPGIRVTIVMMFILQIGHILDSGFDQVWNLQNALIRAETHVLDTYVYLKGIQYADYSFGTAVGLFKGVVALVLVMFANWLSRKTADISLL